MRMRIPSNKLFYTRAAGAMNSISNSTHLVPGGWRPEICTLLRHDGESSFWFSVVLALSPRLCERPGYVVN